MTGNLRVLMAVMVVAATASFEATGFHRAWAGGEDARLLHDARQILAPLPKDFGTAEFPLPPERVELGRKLFFDPRLSSDGTTSCVRCHLPGLYGTDGLAKSRGNHDKLNARNAPTVLNAALQFRQHWRGDRENVEDQAKQSPTGGASFGNPDAGAAAARIAAIPGYQPLFRTAFPGEADPVTPENWGKAIGAYMRTLVSPGRFDDFLRGDTAALSAREERGLRKFIDSGCAGCHDGPGLGGGGFQKFGITADYPTVTGSKEHDQGRFDITHDPKDIDVFKVPPLRNVAMTAPYFHDGSVATLREAVRAMARLELGLTLSEEDTEDISAFLESLTGSLPKNFREAPILPPGGFAPERTNALDPSKK